VTHKGDAMNQQMAEHGATRRERIAKADLAVADARALAKCWQHPAGFSHYMTTCEHWLALHSAALLYEQADMSAMARKVERVRDSRDVREAWEVFDN